jgi:hypothetical protein
VVVSGSLAGWELALILVIVLGAAVVLLLPFMRTFARRFERTRLEPETLARLERVESGLQEVRALQTRVLELEERVDFAERLLPRPDGRAIQNQARD